MYENLVGLQVSNEEMYQEYRKHMRPLLIEHGGDFGYDFKISEVLINASGNPMNRVFTIYFPDNITAKKFFSDSKYVAAKERYFSKSVECTTIIAEYER